MTIRPRSPGRPLRTPRHAGERVRPALRSHRARRTARRSCAADGGSEVHERLVEIVDVAMWQDRPRQRPQVLLARVTFVALYADEHTRQHARNIRVEDRRALAEGEAHDRTGRVRADALERP